jgi:hypothetical protein
MSEEKTERELQIEALRARQAALVPKPQVVQVMPKNDLIRKYLMHMPSRTKFPASGPATWPLDNFTRKRVRDGDVTVEGGEAALNAQPFPVQEPAA